MKKTFKLFISVLLSLTLGGCSKESDASKFKKEYESLNGQKTENKLHDYRNVTIDSDNPFIYASHQDIVNMIDNKEAFFVYFGYNSCPWCRSMIENLVSKAKENNISTIYYVDVHTTRDVYELNDDNNLIKTNDGDTYYMQLLDKLSNVLDDYTLTDDNDNVIEVGEKRIYAPNFIAVVNGKAVAITEGTSPNQTDGYQQIDESMQQESLDMIQEVFDALNSNANGCEVTEPC